MSQTVIKALSYTTRFLPAWTKSLGYAGTHLAFLVRDAGRGLWVGLAVGTAVGSGDEVIPTDGAGLALAAFAVFEVMITAPVPTRAATPMSATLIFKECRG